MRVAFGLLFIALAAAMSLSAARSLALSEHPSGAYLAGQLVGSFFIPIVLGAIGFKWVCASKPGEQAG